MRWLLVVGVVAAVVGCDGGGGQTSGTKSKPAPEVRVCLKSMGFKVVTGRPELGGEEEPDLELIGTRGDNENVFVAFYDDLERAKRLEPGIRKNARNFEGAVKRIDRVTILWVQKPSGTARRDVEDCVSA